MVAIIIKIKERKKAKTHVGLSFKEECDMCLLGLSDHEYPGKEFHDQQGTAKLSDQHCQTNLFHNNSRFHISNAFPDLIRG